MQWLGRCWSGLVASPGWGGTKTGVGAVIGIGVVAVVAVAEIGVLAEIGVVEHRWAKIIIDGMQADITASGLIINMSKSQILALIAVYIGYVINFTDGRLYIKPTRLLKMIQRLIEIMGQSTTTIGALEEFTVSCRQLAEGHGSIASATPVFGNKTRLRLRATNAWISSHTPNTSRAWDVQHPQTDAVREELAWWLSYLNKCTENVPASHLAPPPHPTASHAVSEVAPLLPPEHNTCNCVNMFLISNARRNTKGRP